MINNEDYPAVTAAGLKRLNAVPPEPSPSKRRRLTFVALLICLAVILELVFLLPSPKERRYQAESFVTSNGIDTITGSAIQPATSAT